MTKSLNYLFICFLATLMISCGDCEDKTSRVDDKLLSWMPYEEKTSVSFTNENMESHDYILTPGEDIQTEPDDDCTLTFIKPFIQLGTDEQDKRFNLWFSKTDELVGNDRNQFWGILS